MRIPLVLICILILATCHSALCQPADCVAPAPGPASPSLPLAIDIGGRPGMPPGMGGQAYLAIPVAPPGYACPPPPLPRDILRGEPGDVLGGQPSPDLLRGPGQPRVRIAPP